MTKSVIAYVQDASQKVPLTDIWQQRPLQMAETMYQRLFGVAPGSPIFFVLILMLLMWTVTTDRRRETKFLFAAVTAPLAGLMLMTGNHGSFFPYYLNPHYLPVILLTIMALSKLPRKLWVGMITLLSIFLFLIHTAGIIYNPQVLAYGLGKEIVALKIPATVSNQEYLAVEAFVPNLQPTQYLYLHDWLIKTGQIPPRDFWVHDHTEYFLLWEPPISDGSLVAYQEWRARQTRLASCQIIDKIGIITIERCFRSNN